MPKTKNSSRLPLFEIRVDSPDRDTVLFKGKENEAAPFFLTGTVALSVTEPIHIRKMKLKLYSTLSMNWDEKGHIHKGHTFVRPFKFAKMLYCFEWDQINLDCFLHTNDPIRSSFISRNNSHNSLQNGVGFTTGKLIRSNPGSNTSLKSLASSSNLKAAKSSTNMSSMNFPSFTSLTQAASINNNSNENVVLPPGNYEFPFQLVLDGSLPESIIGHPCISLIYRLQCTIERGRFTNPITTRKLLHVIRTLSADNAELSETIAVDNTWPNKIDYTISVPAKAVPIGSKFQIALNFQPLCKGLKLGTIKIKLVEYSSLYAPSTQHHEEKTLISKQLSKIITNDEGIDIWSDDIPVDEEGIFYKSPNMILGTDKWEVNTSIQLPASLEKTTQDSDILNFAKIRHKLKFSVGLINPDGHISELRATLPITLFISPFVPIEVKTIDEYDDNFTQSNYDDLSVHFSDEKIIFQNEDINAMLLQEIQSHQPHQNSGNEIPRNEFIPTPNINTQDLMAPPNYADRVYDKVFDMNSDDDTNDAAPASVPLIEIQMSKDVSIESTNPIVPPVTNNHSYEELDLSESKTNSFSSVNNLHSQRTTKKKPVFSFAADEDEDMSENHSYFSSNLPTIHQNVIAGPAFDSGERMNISQIPTTNNIKSPGILTPVQHLSRATSFVGDSNLASTFTSSTNMNDKTWKEINEPPSYEVAIHSNASMKDLTPLYNEPEGDIKNNLHILDSRLHNLKISRLDGQLDGSLKYSNSNNGGTTTPGGRKNPFLSTPSISRTSSATSLLKRPFKSNHGSSSSISGLLFNSNETNNNSHLLAVPLSSHSHSHSHSHPHSQSHHLHNLHHQHHSHPHHHTQQHPTIYQNVSFDLGSPNSKSAASTPGLVNSVNYSSSDSYFPTLNSITNNNESNGLSTTQGNNINRPKSPISSVVHSAPSSSQEIGQQSVGSTPKRPALLSRRSSGLALNLRLPKS